MLCIYVYIWLYIYIYIYIYMHVYMGLCVCLSECICMYIYITSLFSQCYTCGIVLLYIVVVYIWICLHSIMYNV